MKLRIILALLASICITSCKKDDPAEPTTYLDPWVGVYQGTALTISNYPDLNSSPLVTITSTSTKDVKVFVSQTTIDSTLNLRFVYDDTLIVNLDEYPFSEQGAYYVSGGGGSSYGYTDILFKEDSMHYTTFQQSGMLSNSKLEFSIPKKCP